MMPVGKGKLTLFDKVIHVTFYQWVHNPDEQSWTLMQAITIRSDKPWPGFQYFAGVLPPTYDRRGATQYKTVESPYTLRDVNKADASMRPAHYGVKPNMRLQLTQLMETVCTEITLSIENLVLEMDIANFTSMYVEAGYAYENGEIELMHRFHATIFSSYIETPNPSGRTVFTGIVGNWFVRGLRAQPYRVIISEGNYTIANFITVICSYLGIIPYMLLTDRVANYVMGITKASGLAGDERGQSGYQVVDWLAKTLMSLTRELRATGDISQDDVIMASFYDNIFSVYQLQKGRPEDKDKAAVNLNKISSASFQGGTLSIVAPWNPRLYPGQLFWMESVFFRGRMMPNTTLKSGVIRDSADLYRPITIDIVFETTGHTNQMKIMAVKANLDEWNAQPEVEADDIKKAAQTTQVVGADGKVRAMTPADAAQEEKRKMGEERGRGIASFYPGEDPYAIGIFAGATYGSPVYEERERRRRNANRLNHDSGDNDIVILLDRETEEIWRDLMGVGGKASEVNADQPFWLTTPDPCRESKHFNKVDMGKYAKLDMVLPTLLANGGTQSAASNSMEGWYNMLLNMTKEGYMAPTEITAIRKDRQIQTTPVDATSGGIIVMDWRLGGVEIVIVLWMLSSIASYKQYYDRNQYKDEKTEELDKEIWMGSTLSWLPITDEYSNSIQIEKFPPCKKASGYESFYIPKLTSGDALNALLRDHIDYIKDVIEYYRGLREHMKSIAVRFKEDKANYSAYNHAMQYLEALVKWHEDWPDTPWQYTGRGLVHGGLNYWEDW